MQPIVALMSLFRPTGQVQGAEEKHQSFLL